MAHHIAIIGGGIGGLATALAFAQRGARVEVFEQAEVLREVGAGLQVTPNGARVLAALGVDIDPVAIRSQAVEPMDARSGRRVARFDLSRLAPPPYRFIHRAALLDSLANACVQAGVTMHLGARIEGPDLPAADLVVGAGGVRCPVRRGFSDMPEAEFTGQVAWRAVLDGQTADPVARIWMGPGQHMVTYPLPGGRLNIVAVQERRDWTADGWSHQDDPSNLRRAFGRLSGRVTGLLAQVDTVHLWGLHRHPVPSHWTEANRVLVGDSAHPTLPFLAQGANLALEDAWVLADACSDGRGPDALLAYQRRRHERVVRAIAAAQANARNYHLTGAARLLGHLGLNAMSRVAPGAFLGRLGWLYACDVTQPVHVEQL